MRGEDEQGDNALSSDNERNGILPSGDSEIQLRRGYTSSEESNQYGNPERGFGKLANQSFVITEENVNKIERHLSKPIFSGDDGLIAPENAKMIERLRIALTEGRPITETDASFYFHELYEADLVNDHPTEWGGSQGVHSLQAGLTRQHLRASRAEKASVVAGGQAGER